MLLYAHRAELPRHEEMKEWLDDLRAGASSFGVVDIVLSGFLRIATHPRAFDPPTPLDQVLEFVGRLRRSPNRVDVVAGARHWDIFVELCRSSAATGNRVPDAFLAALSIESGSEWITTDRGFARYPGLRWRHPLDGLG